MDACTGQCSRLESLSPGNMYELSPGNTSEWVLKCNQVRVLVGEQQQRVVCGTDGSMFAELAAAALRNTKPA